MKKRLLGVLLLAIMGGMSTANASDTGCWEGKGTVPTSTYASWIVYGCDDISMTGESIPIITIYGDDGKGITIKAMNEGSGEVKIGSNNETKAYGGLYIRGNNYPFPNITQGTINKTGAKVDVSTYAPGSYISEIWAGYTGDYKNAWGGSGDEINLNGFWGYDMEDFKVINPIDRKAMCPNGYHIPSIGEWSILLHLWGKNYDEQQKTNHFSDMDMHGLFVKFGFHNTYFSQDMKMPYVGYRYPSGGIANVGSYGRNDNSRYRSSSPVSGSFIGYFSLNRDGLRADQNSEPLYGRAVRCFKNFYIKHPNTIRLNFYLESNAIGSSTILKTLTGSVPDDVIMKITELTNTIKTGHVFGYRYLSGSDMSTGFDFENEPITGGMADDSGNVYFIAKLTPIDYAITYNLDGGTNSDDNPDTYTIESNEITLKEPTKDNHTFEGRYTDANFTIGITSIPTGSTGNITLYAKWKKKSSNRSGGGSSGGGGSNKTGDTQESSSTPQNNSSVSSGTDVKDLKGDTQDSSDKSSEGQTGSQEILSPADDSFTKEQKDAYTFAFKNGITTMNTIDKANMDGYIKRGHLAKMVVNYVTNVLGREIPSDIPAECLSWTDTYRESDEIKDYATKSCALGLMGIEVNHKFNPEKIVPRSQFGAVLSRILRGDKYNLVPTQEKPRYTDHLNALKNEGIMTKIDNPKMQEKRGYVMIMLMRSAKGK